MSHERRKRPIVSIEEVVSSRVRVDHRLRGELDRISHEYDKAKMVQDAYEALIDKGALIVSGPTIQ